MDCQTGIMETKNYTLLTKYEWMYSNNIVK